MSGLRRISALRRRMAAVPVPALLVTNLPDVRYLSGFTGSNAALAITRRAARLFTDGRYTIQAAEEVKAAGPGIKVEIASGSASIAAIQWLAAQLGEQAAADKTAVLQVGFDAAHTTVAELDRWRTELPAKLRRKLLTPTASLVEPLRQLKDEDELAIMRQAAALGDSLFSHLLTVIRPGISEVAVAAELEYQARLRGAEGMSFESIVAAGPRSALPHGRASQAALPRRGFLTLDFGVILNGYCSDMTRTVYLGSPSSAERNTYETVLAAQQAAVAAVRAGVECGVVDEAARSILRTAGIAEAFTHSTGHGVGIEIHEGPRIAAQQKEKLAPGMVITIEPGVYFAGDFGIRIEDMVAVTRTGGELLTHSPKALIEL
ncbi:MAG TPA: Xaa-Pro peptidase family protein [Acidobacteriaceae bacterium]|nr:Xaa-Pro peptidase family protein [Acidobacteriaceae bacterium]